MKKVKFDKEETKNLLGMLKSDDQDNNVIAFKALENADLSEYTGELLVLYKYSHHEYSTWAHEAPKAWSILSKLIDHDTTKPIPLSSGKCLSIMTANKSSKESIEMYLEFFVRDMVGFLGQLGFETDKFVIDIKLKD